MTFRRLADRHYEASASRTAQARFWDQEWDKICDFPITPLSRLADPIWRIPEDWVAVGNRRPHMLTVDFNKIAPSAGDDRICAAVVRRIRRLCLINATVTVRHLGRTLNPPTPRTWIAMSQLMLPMAQHCISLLAGKDSLIIRDGEVDVFLDLSPIEFQKLSVRFPSCCHLWFPRLNAFLASGVISDWPSSDVEKPYFLPREDTRATLPFSDGALTQIMSAALWLNSIHDDVLSAYLDTKDVGKFSNEKRRQSEQYRFRRKAVAAWQSDSMKSGTDFPFGVILAGVNKGKSLVTQWPPDTVAGLRRLVFLCQAARLIIVLFSTALRSGEAAALPPDCLRTIDENHLLAGPRYKDTDAVQGEARMWPFPKAAVGAIENQLDLLERMGSDGKTLWRSFGDRAIDSGLLKVEHAVSGFGSSVTTKDGTPLAEIDGSTTCHRFRYSIARLIGLTLAGAPQILYDVLGHNDIETTMGYSLRDPEFHEMVNQIRAEVKAVQMREAVENVEFNGGRGAELVSAVMRRMLPSFSADALETEDVAEAVKILGDAEMVRPGVLCLAQPLERGACSSTLGIRDVGACAPSCIHRLEQGAQRQDRRSKLLYLFNAAEAACGGALVFYQGQILSCFEAFPDLLHEFAGNAGLRTALRGCTADSWSTCRAEVAEQLTRLFGSSL